MQYRLVTTRNGQIPIDQVQEGTEVLSDGDWKRSPKPARGKCAKCKFDTLPTTIFDWEFIKNRREVSVNHKPVLNKFEERNIGLAVRGYLPHDGTGGTMQRLKLEQLQYWYPRVIKYSGYVREPKNVNDFFRLYIDVMETKPELSGNDLSKENLEEYLQGFLARKFSHDCGMFGVSVNLKESDRIMLRLLDIDCAMRSLYVTIKNPVKLFAHFHVDTRVHIPVTDEMVEAALRHSYELPQYTPGYKIVSKEVVEDWILPGINPDVNCLNPANTCYVNPRKNPAKDIKQTMVKVDSWGRRTGNYRKGNLFDEFLSTGEVKL